LTGIGLLSIWWGLHDWKRKTGRVQWLNI